MPLWVVSLSRGMTIITTAPAIGRKMARLSAQWSNPFMRLLGVHGRDQGRAEDDKGAEQEGGVLLHPSGLQAAEHRPALFRYQSGAVDDAVDHLLVDDVVDEVGDHPSADT